MNKNKKIGFTMAETLITLGLIGTLAAILLPTLQSVQPNQNKILLKKGYQVIERTVNTLLNDDSLYPNEEAFADSTYGGSYLFCQNFQDALNLIDTGACPASGGPSYIGTTPDGIDWYFLSGTFSQSGTDFNNVILFDVNGVAKSPNCATSSSKLPSKYTGCGSSKKPDLFKVGIRWDGKLHIGGTSSETDTYANEVLGAVNNYMNDK